MRPLQQSFTEKIKKEKLSFHCNLKPSYSRDCSWPTQFMSVTMVTRMEHQQSCNFK